MRLLHSLLLSAARYSFSFSSRHVPGVNILIDDALSRSHFHRFAPEALPVPTSIPNLLLLDLTALP